MTFQMRAKHYRAATLVAEDELTNERIAQECGIRMETLYEWRKEPLFQQAVREKIAELDAAVSKIRFAKKRDRIALLSQNVEKYLEVREQRAAYYAEHYDDVPGGKTGLLTPTERQLGPSAGSRVVVDHKTDTGLEKLISDTLVLIAKERGELTEKRELSGPNGTALVPIIEIEVALPSGPPPDRDED